MRVAVWAVFSVLFLATWMVQAEPDSPHIVVPCEVVEVYDGDTMTLRVTTDIRVRLVDCWAPEIKTKDLAEKKRGEAARDHLKSLAKPGAKGLLSVSLGGVTRSDQLFTMGRLLGRVSIEGKDLSAQQVQAGHATASKQKP